MENIWVFFANPKGVFYPVVCLDKWLIITSDTFVVKVRWKSLWWNSISFVHFAIYFHQEFPFKPFITMVKQTKHIELRVAVCCPENILWFSRWFGSTNWVDNLKNCHRKGFLKLTFRLLTLRQIEWRWDIA